MISFNLSWRPKSLYSDDNYYTELLGARTRGFGYRERVGADRKVGRDHQLFTIGTSIDMRMDGVTVIENGWGYRH